MTEKIFNLFLFVDDKTDLVREIGFVTYEHVGDDAELMRYLRARVNEDHQHATRRPVPRKYGALREDGRIEAGALLYAGFMNLANPLEVFEEVFRECDAPQAPMVCVTPIVDGKPRIERLVRW